MLPDFLGIGPMKTGSTWLYKNLQKHPKIEFGNPKIFKCINEKELHYFDKKYPRLGLEWYNTAYSHTVGKDVLRGDFTPGYFIRLDKRKLRFILGLTRRRREFWRHRRLRIQTPSGGAKGMDVGAHVPARSRQRGHERLLRLYEKSPGRLNGPRCLLECPRSAGGARTISWYAGDHFAGVLHRPL